MNDLGLKQIVEDWTHIMWSSRTMIDLAITNCDNIDVNIIDEPGVSLHRTLIIYGIIEDIVERKTSIRDKIDISDCKYELSKITLNYKSGIRET